MELAEFIASTLLDVASGVRSANEAIKARDKAQDNCFGLTPTSATKPPRGIEFDVAVTASTEEGKAGGGQLKIAVANLGASAEAVSSKERVSRIKFMVDVQVYMA